MDSLITAENLNSSEFITHLTETRGYKPIPLGLFAFIQSLAELKDSERSLWLLIYMKSDFYSHTLPYIKDELVAISDCSERTFERRINKLQELELIKINRHSIKGTCITIEIPKKYREEILTKSTRRITKSSIQSRKSSKRYNSINGTAQVVLYPDSQNIYITNEVLSKVSLETIAAQIIDRLNRTSKGTNQDETPKENKAHRKQTLRPQQKKENLVTEAKGQDKKRTTEVLHELIENKDKLKKITAKVNDLAIHGELEKAKQYSAEKLALSKKINELEQEKRRQECRAVRTSCGEPGEKHSKKHTVTTNLSVDNDNPDVIPYFNNINTCNKNTGEEKTDKEIKPKNNRTVAKPQKIKNPPNNYTKNQAKSIPKQLIKQLEKGVEGVQASNPRALLEELKFAVAREFVGKPPEIGSPSHFDTMRFNTCVALKKLKSGEWRTPSGLIAEQKRESQKLCCNQVPNHSDLSKEITSLLSTLNNRNYFLAALST